MRSSHWRHYRGHLIVKSKAFLGIHRFEVWRGSELVGMFASVVRAELHVDRVLGQRGHGGEIIGRSGTHRPMRPFGGETTGEPVMLWTIAVILLILWALGFLAFHVGGGLIHLLLVIAVIVIIWNLIAGRRSV
jgi:hypothetical protein